MRSEELATPNRVNYPSRVEKHRAKRAIKRRLKPDARGLVGSRGKAPSGVNFLFDFAHKKWAEPQ